MGTHNQQLRQAKQRRRNKRRDDRDSGAAHEGETRHEGTAWRQRMPVDELIEAVAEAVALGKPDADALVDYLVADPKVVAPLDKLIARHWVAAQARG